MLIRDREFSGECNLFFATNIPSLPPSFRRLPRNFAQLPAESTRRKEFAKHLKMQIHVRIPYEQAPDATSPTTSHIIRVCTITSGSRSTSHRVFHVSAHRNAARTALSNAQINQQLSRFFLFIECFLATTSAFKGAPSNARRLASGTGNSSFQHFFLAALQNQSR